VSLHEGDHLMASDITLAVGDGSRRMSYAALAEARGISVLAARQLTRRHRWHKQVGNDGLVVVSVPLSALANPQKSAKSSDAASRHSITAADTASDTASDTVSDAASDAVRAFEAALSICSAQLEQAAADKAELRQQLDRERTRADRAEAQISEALTAEQLARAEADDLRAVLDTRQQWGLARRLRWALGRKR
jgi:hypothetical protein